MDLLVLFVEALFVVLFAATLVQYLRRPDPVSRDVALTFSALGVLFVLNLLGKALGGSANVPQVLSIVGGVLFILQPIFTLHLVSLVRRVPFSVLAGATMLILVSGLPIFLIRPLPAAAIVAAFVVFVGIELLSAAYLLLEARRRRGPGAARLALAGLSTAVFGVALLIAIGGQASAALSEVATPLGSVLALLAAVGYLIAFVPPRAVRRVWQASTTVDYGRSLLGNAGASVAAIWGGFADIAAAMNGGAAAVVVAADASGAEVIATAGLPRSESRLDASRSDLDALLSAAHDGPERSPAGAGPLAERLAELAKARFVSVVPVIQTSSAPAALLILSRYRSLFHSSDLDLLATLGSQTAIVAERRAILAEQEALTVRLATSVEALRSASQAKSDFLASMSHELRTPLSAILGFSELMRQEAREGESVSVPIDWIEHVHRGGEHLLTLINDVLDLAKVEAGRLELRPERFDIGVAIAESINGLRPLAERKRLQLVGSSGPLTVMADRGRFRQMLYNLISNAIKYTPEGGLVRVEAAQADGNVHVAVIDTGVGIAPADQQAVFEEFRQVGDPSERQPGTGLGLALTKRLIEAHGGRIEVESTRGSGSRFTLIIPSAPAGADLKAAESPAPRIHVRTDSPEVLVIEDDPSVVRLLREYMEPAGYRVRVAPDGETGIAMAAERRPAAAILDVLLPGVDGWEALRRLKADAELRDVPVVMATVVDEREVGFALGAVDYLVKPIQRQALLDSLARYAPPPANGPSNVRVLAVDDEPAALDFIRAALEPAGFTVKTVPGGREALAAARSEPFDLIVLDLVMPDVDGFEVISSLKGDPRTAAIPILVCTAHDPTPADKERLNGKILGIVTKGIDARDGLRQWLATASAPGLGT